MDDLEDLTRLERLGAAARALGKGVVTNPFLQIDALPEKTGEDILNWGMKMQAWANGWRQADSRV